MGREAGGVNAATAQRLADIEFAASELWRARAEREPSEREVDALIEHFGRFTFAELQIVFEENVQRICNRALAKAKRVAGRRCTQLNDREIMYFLEKN